MQPPQQIRISRMQLNLFRLTACVFATVLFLWIGEQEASTQSLKKTASPTVAKSSTDALVPTRTRVPAPDLRLIDINQKALNLGDYRGKVVLLDFWAVDCGGCVIEIPWYVEFDKKYHDKGLQVIGIDMYGESPAYIKPFMQKSHMQYPVAVGNDDIRNRFHADELPKTILIDRQGRVAVTHVGIVDKATFEKDIQYLLK